jgi:hypothetical protein
MSKPWIFRPNGPVLERLEWMTDVITAFDAKEQRIPLRLHPRRVFEFEVGLIDRERRIAENLLHNWQAQPFDLPVWMDRQALQADAAIAETELLVDTTTRDFQAGGKVLLCDGTPLVFELSEIEAVADGMVTLAEPLAAAWPAGSEVYPVRSARLQEDFNLARFTGSMSYGVARFECVDLSPWPAATGGSVYRGFQVLAQAPNWTRDVEQGFMRKVARFDPGTGPALFDEEGGGAVLMQSHRWLLDGRAEIDAFRRWLYARRGMLSAFWLPTFALDFDVVAPIGPSDTTIDVEHCGYTGTIGQDIGRRDIRITLHSGTTYDRRITASAELSADVERLTIDSALGASVTLLDIESISYLDLVRLAGDGAEIVWHGWDLAEAQLNTRGSRNDL